MFYLSGEIPRLTAYERGLPADVRLAGDGNSWEPDPLIRDERYVAAHVRGKGIVVLTACSHSGVVNVLTDARKVFGDVPIYGVMGGPICGPRSRRDHSRHRRDLGAFPLQRIDRRHRTGWRAVHTLASVYSEEVLVAAAVGRQFTF